MYKTIAIAALGLLLASQVQAQTISTQAADYTPETIARYDSTPDESPQQFIDRIAPDLRAYTAANGVEVCGWLATDGSTYALIVQTIRSKVSCWATQHPMDMDRTGDMVHTHPKAGMHRLDRADAARVGYSLIKLHPEAWSPADTQYPGYLITPTTVLHRTDTVARK